MNHSAVTKENSILSLLDKKSNKKSAVNKNYSDSTYNSKNSLKRFAHRKRFKTSIELIDIKENMRLLDFGCGNGLFLNQLKESTGKNIHLVGFEPFMEPLILNSIKIEKDWERIEDVVHQNGLFDYITCFEVLEHFSPEKQIEIIQRMKKVLSPDGYLIISTPIEKGFSSLIKNIIRKIDFPKSPEYTFKNITASLFGKSLAEIRTGQDYLTHMGFYFHDLEKILVSDFIIESKFYSPLKWFGYNFNSQVFYKLKLRT